jgi:4'-phosphopantetheinyl transferase
MMSHCSFALTQRDVHVWTLRTETSDAVAAKFESFLAPDEKDRAGRFRFSHLRRAFVSIRGALRCLLGRYLNLEPASIGFNYASKGKPALATAAGLEFNIAHSGSLAVFAFTANCQIGVDLEHVRPLRESQQIADQFFCKEEAAEIASFESSERDRAFFSCWTRKEAYIKATGDGLSVPLSDFRVALQPHEPIRFVHLAKDANAAKAWTLHDLRLASDYAAALTYRDRPRPILVFPSIHAADCLSV